MRRTGLATLGAGATATALLATGVVTGSLAILVAPPVLPSAAAADLRPFADCEELRRWYVATTLSHVTAWGLDGFPDMQRQTLTVTDSLASGAGTAEPAASSDSGTNIQEAGVDEPDVAKTDGRLVVHLTGRRLVITDTGGERPRRVSSTLLPRQVHDAELLRTGDTVTVLGSGYEYLARFSAPDGIVADIAPPARQSTTIVSVDISDPAQPRIENTERIDGRLVSAREYDGTIRAVVSTAGPDLPFVAPDQGRTYKDARVENRRLVRNAAIERWLPSSRTPGDATRTPLLDCTDVRHPEKHSGFGTLSILTFDADNPAADRESTGITAGGELVYSSTDRLYVATSSGWWGGPVPLIDGRRARALRPSTTEVHAFAVDGTRTRYVASGQVAGTVRDRWSFSEHDGHLRVATALGRDPWNPRENAVSVLDEVAGELVEVGHVGGMGRHEQIQSVRWFGEVAVVVTFRQVDPLYTLDLSDPTDPRVLGELKIRGFSAYLHPLGDDLLLGLGQDATRQGTTTGAQAATFDIVDLGNPRRRDTELFGRNTELAAQWDARAFTYLPDRRIALSPVQSWRTGHTRMAILSIDDEGRISRTLTRPVAAGYGTTVRALPLDDGRVAVVSGATVTLLDPG